MSDETTSQSQSPSGQVQPYQPPEQGQGTEKEERETREALDELKTALAQLATAATKIGHIAQVKVREEWKTTRPELQKTIEEMKRGVESAATRASSTLDNLAKKVDKPAAGQAQGEPTAPSQPPTEPRADQPPSGSV
ncbi:MAG: hypothetical protein ACRDJW_13610 [Thermomicrobiales bacterium]